MLEIRRTDLFNDWLTGLRSMQDRLRIVARFKHIARGNLGDWKPVGQGVCELRFHFGPGYRVYFTRRGDRIIVLLAGGDKSTQAKDIATAIRIAGMEMDHDRKGEDDPL